MPKKASDGSPYLFYLDQEIRKHCESPGFLQQMKMSNERWKSLDDRAREEWRRKWRTAMDNNHVMHPQLYRVLRFLVNESGVAVQKKTNGSANRRILPNSTDEWQLIRQEAKRSLLDRWECKLSHCPYEVMDEHHVVITVTADGKDITEIEMALILFTCRNGVEGAFEKKYNKSDRNYLVKMGRDVEVFVLRSLPYVRLFTLLSNFEACESMVKSMQTSLYPLNDYISVETLCIEDLFLAMQSWLEKAMGRKINGNVEELEEAPTGLVMCLDHLNGTAQGDYCPLQWAVYAVCNLIKKLSKDFPECEFTKNPTRFFPNKYHQDNGSTEAMVTTMK